MSSGVSDLERVGAAGLGDLGKFLGSGQPMPKVPPTGCQLPPTGCQPGDTWERLPQGK